MRNYVNSTCLILFFSFVTIKTHAQLLPDSTLKKIDRLFKKWDNYNSPGCAIGIIRNDSLIYAKGYGMANLEYGIRITPETIFHIASVSKQFTAYAIVLLAKQGRLQLDDDVRKYLSWFPDLKVKITIRNLLNHTSGIRDQFNLLAIAGTRLDDVITQEQIIKILSHQQTLDFKPGERFNYSNSGYTMAAEIVKSVTGQTLRQFTDSAIFKPLGMNNTHFHDDYTEVVKNRSYSYERIDSLHYSNSILSYSQVGATGLFTNINDLSKWVMNFYDFKVGGQKAIEQLTQKSKLNNGIESSYALGIGVETNKGWKLFAHDGSDAGYRTVMVVFPDLKMGLLVFSNLGEIVPGRKALEIANLLITDTTQKNVSEIPKEVDSSNAMLKDTLRFKSYIGDYIADDGSQCSFKMERQKVYWQSYGNNSLLMKSDKDTFIVFQTPSIKFVFSTTVTGDKLIKVYSNGNEQQFIKFTLDSNQTDKQLQAYTGLYYCPELDCKYGIGLQDHHLLLTNGKYQDTKLTLRGKDHLLNELWWIKHLVILRDGKSKIIGFEVNNDRIMHLRFNKIK
jgi:CubicO group peptidase (beta-lactamase class C family)